MQTETVTAKPKSSSTQQSLRVTPDNFARAESDMYFSNVAVREDSLGKFGHRRELFSIDNQVVVRGNRDTLYSSAVIDLDAGPVTVTLPEAGNRFMSLMACNEDHYAFEVQYGAGSYSFSKDTAGTRYILLAVRTLVDPNDAADLKQAHVLQDAIKIDQAGGAGKFEIPAWDNVSQDKVRKALVLLGETMPDFSRAFGKKDEVDPVKHLIGSATGWGGNPDKDAQYLNITPQNNDGKTIYRLTVKDVPVDGFWSISVYNDTGYYEKNAQNAYTLNNITAKKEDDGSIIIQFGGCDGQTKNCLPITPGWNYMVRLYRPAKEILDGSYKFPDPVVLK